MILLLFVYGESVVRESVFEEREREKWKRTVPKSLINVFIHVSEMFAYKGSTEFIQPVPAAAVIFES
tara:strand:+ start:109 stop:309 length:201 start_codon:yes stop_codon:yes gene_type:complete